MSTEVVNSDVTILDLLRKMEPMGISELALATNVTATAVRQRLNRLMGQGYIERFAEKVGRGRPSHQYRLTKAGRRKTGANFADLAIALWGGNPVDQGSRSSTWFAATDFAAIGRDVCRRCSWNDHRGKDGVAERTVRKPEDSSCD